MDTSQFVQRDEACWEIPAKGNMRVPAIIYADAQLLGYGSESLRADHQCRDAAGDC